MAEKSVMEKWTEEELGLRRRVLAGETVVYDRHSAGCHARFHEWAEAEGVAVYIGRRDPWGRWPQSDWHNPYSVKKHGLDEALRLYQEHLLNSPDLMARIPELRGRALGCWCKCREDDRCHGDVLVKLADSVETP